nr:centrosomal protein of 55 kDa-like isoform X3 [Solea senegalensis]
MTKMASSKYKDLVWKRKRLDMVISCLRKENACLKKALVELSRQHSKHLKLVQRFISLQTVRMENSQQLMDEHNKTASPPVLSKKGSNLMEGVNKDRVSAYARETEEIKNKLVSLSARCQYLENKVKGKKESDEQGSNYTQTELENHLRDALEKNKHLLEYDQQREACVRAVMARMLWLERQLNEANQARSNQDNEDHSDEKKKMCQMQEFYERLLQKAKEELDVLREQLNLSKQKLTTAQKWCKEREMEVEELKQQLHGHCSEYEVKHLTEKTEDLEYRLHKEKRRTATFELQIKLLQKYLLNSHRGDQERIADLEAKLSSLKPTSTSRSVLNESFLNCPGCLAQYPASHYQDLIKHMEFCLD